MKLDPNRQNGVEVILKVYILRCKTCGYRPSWGLTFLVEATRFLSQPGVGNESEGEIL